MNNSTVDIHVQDFLWIYGFFSVGVAGTKVTLKLLRNL